jgi:hypothetical protein
MHAYAYSCSLSPPKHMLLYMCSSCYTYIVMLLYMFPSYSVSIRQRMLTYARMLSHTTIYVSLIQHQHTSAYADVCSYAESYYYTCFPHTTTPADAAELLAAAAIPADVCGRMLTFYYTCRRGRAACCCYYTCRRLRTYADVCCRSTIPADAAELLAAAPHIPHAGARRAQRKRPGTLAFASFTGTKVQILTQLCHTLEHAARSESFQVLSLLASLAQKYKY